MAQFKGLLLIANWVVLSMNTVIKSASAMCTMFFD